jgi:transposase InsO family protein
MIVKNNFEDDAPMSLGEACHLVQVSRSGYLDWNGREPKSDDFEQEVMSTLHRIAEEFPYYGYKRMTKALKREGLAVNHKRIYRLMADEKLLCIRKKFKPVTTQSNHGFPTYSNLAKDFIPQDINQLVVSDITYIALQSDFVYLAILMDVFSRRFVGWGLSREANSQLVLNALNRAIALRGAKNMKGCIHHSDQGVQYASHAYIQRLAEVGMLPSMSEKGNSYDNAYAESAIKTIKYNEVHMKEYESFEDAYFNIKKFIEEVYNKKQLHSGIGYIPPEEFEKTAKN